MFSTEVLLEFGAEELSFFKGDLIFNEDQTPRYFYQVMEGSVKMFNLTEDGKEFIQGIFDNGQSFGEPPLFGEFKYPASASCLVKSSILRLSKSQFFRLLKEKPDWNLELTKTMCHRLYYKSMIMKEVSVHTAGHRITSLLQYLKTRSGKEENYEVELSRQQIAEMTGLRVETVIRTLKKLVAGEELKIENRKIII